MASSKSIKYDIHAEDRTKQGIDSSIKNLLGLDDAVKKVGKSFTDSLKIVAIVAGLKELATQAFAAVEAFGAFERSQIQLESAFNGNAEAMKNMNGLIAELSSKSLSSKEDIMKMVGSLASLGKSEADIKKISAAALNLSNITGQGLNESMKAVNSTLSGETGEIGKLIPEIRALTKEQLASGSAMDIINQKFGKMSNQLSQGITQQIKNMKDSWKDLQVELGKNLAPLFEPLIGFIGDIAKSWTAALKEMRAYKDAQAQLDSGKKLTELPPDLQLSVVNKQLKDAQTARRTELASAFGGATTPEDLASSQGISIKDARSQFQAVEKASPEISALNKEIATLTASALSLGKRIEVSVSTGQYGVPASATPPVATYAEGFADFMKRMKESSAQWDTFNDLTKSGVSSATISTEMLKKYNVTSPTSPATADYSRLQANASPMFGQFLEKIFKTPEAIKAQQDAIKKAEEAAKALADLEEKKNSEILSAAATANAAYLDQLKQMNAASGNATLLRYNLEIEHDRALTEAKNNGLINIDALELVYAQKRIDLNKFISEEEIANKKKEAAAAYALRVSNATSAGVRDLGNKDAGLISFEWLKSLSGKITGAGEGMKGSALGGMAGGATEAVGGALGGLAPILGTIVGAMSSLAPVMQIIQPMGVVLKGIMSVLSPIINSLLQPLLGMLMIVGQLIGGLLAPALQILMPIIEAVSMLFIWLYNSVVRPIYNSIMMVFNMIYNAFADFINGILWLVDQIPFVDVGRVSKRDNDAGFLAEIDMTDILNAGAEAGSTAATSSASGSAQYTQGRSITMNFYENAGVYGDGGIRNLARLVKQELLDLDSLGQ